jgi:membrane-associated HD superfamily phosphohydrolase
VGLIVVISAILVLPLALPGRVELAAGQPARTDIFAPQYVRYESEVLTEQDRANARLATGPVYESNISLVDSQRRRLNDVL